MQDVGRDATAEEAALNQPLAQPLKWKLDACCTQYGSATETEHVRPSQHHSPALLSERPTGRPVSAWQTTQTSYALRSAGMPASDDAKAIWRTLLESPMRLIQ